MSEEKPQENYALRRLLKHTFVLLDYLERQSDNRLQAQFDHTRKKMSLNFAKLAIAPCDEYEQFLPIFHSLETKPDVSLTVEDEAFLPLSRDFLAAVAHPATVETICITREYINTRNTCGLRDWYIWRLQGADRYGGGRTALRSKMRGSRIAHIRSPVLSGGRNDWRS
jgi:hypothetical protein